MHVLQQVGGITLSLALLSTAPVHAAETPQQWFQSGQRAVWQAQRLPFNTGLAKNVILFVGDGMGISTVTAARILEGQQREESGDLRFAHF